MIKKFELLQRVYWEDTDAGRRSLLRELPQVHGGVCRTEWLRSLGIDQLRLRLDRRLQFAAVVSVAVDFLLPAVLNDEIIVTAELERFERCDNFVQADHHARRGPIDRREQRRASPVLDSGTLKPRCYPQGTYFWKWRNGQ